MAYIAITMNIIVFVALFDRKIKTPTTVLMQGLAMADSLTAICTYGFEPLFMAYYDEIGDSKKHEDILAWQNEIMKFVSLRFPQCWFHYLFTNLTDTFHLASVLLTTSLGLQKMLAVLCPIWSKTKTTQRKTGVVCGICFLVSIAISIPRLFVVSFTSFNEGNINGTGDICLVSEPHALMEKYVLTYYPVLLMVVLTLSVLMMMVSTCFIIVILWRRKRVRGHTSVSISEKKSCILILSVMVVFVLSEIPRLYINSTVFYTYRFNLEKNENIAFYRSATEISKDFDSCLYDLELRLWKKFDIIIDDFCFDLEVPPYYTQMTVRNMREQFVKRDYKFYTVKLKYKFRIERIIENRFHLMAIKLAKLIFCGIVRPSYSGIIKSEKEKFTKCLRSHFEYADLKYPLYLLGSTPYSEPMNYILNIIWEQWDISLKNLKIFIEILKLSTIFGCLSNFIIYIIMSEKLRECLARKLKCWRDDQQRRPEEIEMN
ncbi:Hypothetical predicted protein [Mytilus galloprovincialis]|uniref:G-protein coupled receptors family 1 profile domain-containing protein n=1 Tax=Mytilus galloprovincialis TaxID=29158 RepID=A0A8B6BHE4_MYTGA|nr:Hypothetical predicted protein [Mytilus galloprovincialis]